MFLHRIRLVSPFLLPLFFKTQLDILIFFFLDEFQNYFQIHSKSSVGILIQAALNLQINLGTTDLLATLFLPFQIYNMCFYLVILCICPQSFAVQLGH